MTDPLERLGMTDIVEDFGLASVLVVGVESGDPATPRLRLLEPGDGDDRGRVVRAIAELEPTLNPEQRQLLTTIVAGTAAHMLDLAAPYVQAWDQRSEQRRQGPAAQEAWLFARTLWAQDPTIRTGAMVAAVREHLQAQGFRVCVRTARELVAYLAPPEAKRPGRPRKSGKSASGNISDRS